jgi:hypothetical protein
MMTNPGVLFIRRILVHQFADTLLVVKLETSATNPGGKIISPKIVLTVIEEDEVLATTYVDASNIGTNKMPKLALFNVLRQLKTQNTKSTVEATRKLIQALELAKGVK